MRALLAVLLLVLSQPASGQSDPNAHRLLLGPTARPVEAGRVTLALTEVIVPNAAVGLGGGVSLGAGVVVLPDAWGEVFVEPKWTVLDTEALALAVGGVVRGDVAEGEGHALPYVVGTATRGRAALTLTVGARIDYERPRRRVVYSCPVCLSIAYDEAILSEAGREWALVPAPTATLGAEIRLTPTALLLAEVVVLPDSRPLSVWSGDGRLAEPRSDVMYDLTAGLGTRVRLGRASLDLGVLVVSDDDGGSRYTEAGPWLNVGVGL